MEHGEPVVLVSNRDLFIYQGYVLLSEQIVDEKDGVAPMSADDICRCKRPGERGRVEKLDVYASCRELSVMLEE